MAVASLTLRDVVVEARAVPPFTGENTYALSSFINEVETLTGMITEAEPKAYIYRILLTKIQGAAATTIRKLLDTSWSNIKTQLIKSFGVAEDYLQLKEKADNFQQRNVSALYNYLSVILDKLNLKYSLDTEKPNDFKPVFNEKSILEKFLNKIDRTDAMYVRTRNISTLEEAYQALLKTGIVSHYTSNKNDYQTRNREINRNKRNVNHNSEYPVRNYNNNYPNNSGANFRNSGNNFHNGGGFNNYNRNFQVPSRNFARRGQSGQFLNREHNRNNPSNGFVRRHPGQDLPAPEPMDIEHNDAIQSENFRVVPREQCYR